MKSNFPSGTTTLNYQQSDNSKTLNIIEAAKFLGAHKETVRRMVASGVLPGVKIGRAWVFIEQDLITYVRSLYRNNRSLEINNKSRSSTQWQSPKEITSGGSTSHTMEEEYVKVLGLK
ncbi:helix-turn-helix domain-containing protein [Legionella yabuuchiae]|uniref:helix-turn-helix domain-containing protein n=1 Tax=Legionella yabuuchiae TaxID=376727 RepID=UPI001054F0F2|nr:helix-turn-helix domain-containing protein [Legionella yabuuchiae]